MLSHMRMGVPYEYTHMGRPIRVWANIRTWGRTYALKVQGDFYVAAFYLSRKQFHYSCRNNTPYTPIDSIQLLMYVFTHDVDILYLTFSNVTVSFK